MASSQDLFARSRTMIPGGVNSPVRSFSSVGGTPIYIKSGKGPIIEDVENRKYIDFCLSWGPMILGHAHEKVVTSIAIASAKGISFGTNTPMELDMATLIKSAFPSIDKVRLTTSGTEATMTALRLARGFTGRNKVVKFEGCYHGHADAFLVNAGSGLLTNSISSSKGVPESVVKDTLICPYNDINGLSEIFKAHGKDIACIIVEPIAGNMGLIMPEPNFLETLDKLAKLHGALLIFDEVITGFRFCFGGYQNIVNIKPDLTTLGKIIGGGLPIGAVGGRAEIMDNLAPLGAVYQAGTLSGNPIALAAGVATLELLKEKSVYKHIEENTNLLVDGIKQLLHKKNYAIQHYGSLFGIYFQKQIPKNLTEMKKCDIPSFNSFFHKLLLNGVYMAPSQFETNFVSIAHNKKVVEEAIEAINKSI